jgi:hypothetical protein
MRVYDAFPSGDEIRLAGDRVLVNADVLVGDPALHAWLRGAAPFDAVTLWFTGGHKARSITKTARRIGAESDEDFRWAIEAEVVELATRYLRPGGLVQLVNLASGDQATRRREVEAQRRAGIAAYPFDPISVSTHPYVESDQPGAMVMRGPGGADAAGRHMAVSTLLRARNTTTEAATAGLFRLARRTPFNIAPERAGDLATTRGRSRRRWPGETARPHSPTCFSGWEPPSLCLTAEVVSSVARCASFPRRRLATAR